MSLLNEHPKLMDDVGLVIGMILGSLCLLLSVGFAGFWVLGKLMRKKDPSTAQTFGVSLIYVVAYSIALGLTQLIISSQQIWSGLIFQWALMIPFFALAIGTIFRASMGKSILWAPVFSLFAILPMLIFAVAIKPTMQPSLDQAAIGLPRISKELKPEKKEASLPEPGTSFSAKSIVRDRVRTMSERALAVRRLEMAQVYKDLKIMRERAAADPALGEEYARRLKIYNDAMAQFTADEAALMKGNAGKTSSPGSSGQ